MLRLLLRAACALAAAALLITAPARAATTLRLPAHRAHPRGYVLTIHGGGWYRVGPRMVARMHDDGLLLRSWGYATVNVDYRAGARSFDDVLSVYDLVRRRVGPQMPICAYGASAGGHLALMLAIRRPALTCVIAQAPPVLLDRLPARLRAIAERFFGPAGGLAAWSPALHPLRVPLLLEQAHRDRVVGFGQSLAMHAADPNSRLIPLRRGSAPWIHASVDARELAAAHAVERRFLGRWARVSAPAPQRARWLAPVLRWVEQEL